MARNYVALPFEYLEEFEDLTYEEVGRLVCALLHYGATGEEKKPEGREGLLWRRVVKQEDRYQESYEDVLNARREAGKKGAEVRWGKKEEPSADEDPHSKNSKAIFAIGKSGNKETETETKTETKTETESKLSPSSEGGVCKARARADDPSLLEITEEQRQLVAQLMEGRRRRLAAQRDGQHYGLQRIGAGG